MAGGERVVWTLGAGEDLNANLVRFGAGPEGFAYLTVHRRRGPIRIGH